MKDLESRLKQDGARLKCRIEPSSDLQKRVNAAVYAAEQPAASVKTQSQSVGYRWIGWATAAATVIALYWLATPTTTDLEINAPSSEKYIDILSSVQDDLPQELEYVEQDIESVRKEIQEDLDYWL